MTKNQEDKLGMYLTVKEVTNNYEEIWSANATFTTHYNSFLAKVTDIGLARDAQMANIKGVTAHKNTIRKDVEERATFVANRLQTLALATKDEELFNAIDYTMSDFQRFRDTNLIGPVHMVLGKALAHAAALVFYDVQTETITDLSTASDAFADIVTKPRWAEVQKKKATNRLKTLFLEAEELLTGFCDRNIEVFKTTAPDFYEEYQLARVTMHSGSSKLSIKGHIFNTANNDSLKDVTVTIEQQVPDGAPITEPTIVKKTTALGNFLVKKLIPGPYQIRLDLDGFRTKFIATLVLSGNTMMLDEGMDPDE